MQPNIYELSKMTKEQYDFIMKRAEMDITEQMKIAKEVSDDIRDRAQQYERETRYAAEDYAEQVFTHLEENLKSLTGTVARCRQQLNEGANQQQNGGW